MGGSQLRSRADAFTADGHLACSDEREILVAMQHLDGLLRAAAALLGASGHHPHLRDCAAAACLLAEVTDGPALCHVAHRLVGDRPTPATSSPVLELALTQFRAALPDAMDAVRACRQQAHPSGTCWFSAAPGEDGCGAVLRLAHALC
ncbi:hypothetical protein [Egicoccus sp. AB-alg6-2]|uniref:hypothetical protein n=1 Tax=Egicoccus sp. AB-alg6-2 TaxID=3242692 RepID=UPI00359D9665